MGFITDQLRKKLANKRKKKQLNKIFKKMPLKDITFMPASAAAEDITAHVNNRMQFLIQQVGGLDKFGEGDFSIQYVDKTKGTDIVQKGTKVLGKKTARESFSTTQPIIYDWEAIEEEIVSELAPTTNVDHLQFYMIIIEYTQIKEVV